MDYAKLKDEIKEIADIAASVPEEFRAKCFELLLQSLLAAEPAQKPPVVVPPKEVSPITPTPPAAPAPAPAGSVPVTTAIRVFMQRTSVTKEELEQVLLVDNGEVHFIREPSHGTVSRGQMEWALLLALKNAVVGNDFSTDPEDVRSICQEKGFYDRANFAATFKRQPYAGYFRQPLEPQGARQPLTNEGQTALGELVKSLARAE